MSEMGPAANIIPRRFVTEKAAQEYFGLDKARWSALRKLNLIPSPVALIGLYDLKALDRAFDRLSGLGSPDELYQRPKFMTLLPSSVA